MALISTYWGPVCRCVITLGPDRQQRERERATLPAVPSPVYKYCLNTDRTDIHESSPDPAGSRLISFDHRQVSPEPPRKHQSLARWVQKN